MANLNIGTGELVYSSFTITGGTLLPDGRLIDGGYVLYHDRTPPRADAASWRCFHCDEVFNDKRAAALHFGVGEEQAPACQIKAAEGGWVNAIREADIAELAEVIKAAVERSQYRDLVEDDDQGIEMPVSYLSFFRETWQGSHADEVFGHAARVAAEAVAAWLASGP